MHSSRREFLARSAPVVATGMLGALAATGYSAEPPAAKTEKPSSQKSKAMVAACGISCQACPLLKAGKCKGCATGKEASAEMLKKKPCPVLKCAAGKKIDYCGTGCKKFAECGKLVGHPYAKSFLDMMKKRMGTTT